MNTTAETPVSDLLLGLAEKGISVSLDGGNLRLRSMKTGLITSEVKATLSQRKPEIVKTLRNDQAIEDYRKNGFIKIFSCFLNKTIFLARDKKAAEQVPEKNLPVYFENEIEALKDLSIEELRTLHDAKCIFRGTISDAPKK